jgi:CubicO group peptidase (beta-lactamase class C family)
VVDRVAQRYLGEAHLVGLSVAVARDGRIVHESAYGLARRTPDLAADATVPFELFSLSKPVTAVLLLRLAERGLLDLDKPSSTYVPGLPAEYASATLRQLLRHTSGNSELAVDALDPDPRYLRAPSRDDLLAWLATGKRSAAPDETWIYASAGYVAAGLAAEAVAQRTLGELIRDEMALPLGLGRLAWCPELATTHSLAYVAASGTTTRSRRSTPDGSAGRVRSAPRPGTSRGGGSPSVPGASSRRRHCRNGRRPSNWNATACTRSLATVSACSSAAGAATR